MASDNEFSVTSVVRVVMQVIEQREWFDTNFAFIGIRQNVPPLSWPADCDIALIDSLFKLYIAEDESPSERSYAR